MRKRGEAGLLGIFRHEDRLARAAERLRAEGRAFDVFSPTRGEWMHGLTRRRVSPVRLVVLSGALAGILAGVGLAVYSFLPFRMITGGKPVVPFVPLVVIAFEFMVLVGVLTLLGGMLAIGRIPRRKLPPAYDARFSEDRFGLLVSAGSGPDVRKVLEECGAEEVRDVPG